MAVFLAIWVWLLYKPMSYLDGVYPQWIVGDTLLRNCDLDELTVLGDSRVGIAIIPLELPVATTVLAQPGAGPLEVDYIAKRLARCPTRPRRVLISFSMKLFTQITSWNSTIRIGLLPAEAIQAIRRVEARIGDYSLDEAPSLDGLPHAIRPWAYSVRFPPIYLNSLVNGLLVGREGRNQQVIPIIVASRGHVAYDGLPEWHGVSEQDRLEVFRPLPLLDAFFERTIATLQKAGIETYFAIMPINEDTYDAIPAPAREAFTAYLMDYAARYKSFHILGDPMPRWPDRYFGDEALHLNPRGQQILTHQLAECLARASADMAATCELGRVPDGGWRDLSLPQP